MNIVDYLKGRENNFNLLRVLAATAVLISHSFSISTGDYSAEPLRAWIEMTPGSIAVDIFFVISGFLVTASLFKRNDPLEFVVSRAIRIFPGLVVMLAVTVLFVGPIFTVAPLREYFGWQAVMYFFSCATAIGGVSLRLPGLFVTNPYSSTVNSSLWTLTWELRCYIGLLIMWQIAAMSRRRGFYYASISILILLYILVQLSHHFAPHFVRVIMPLTMFFLGVVLWQFREVVSFGKGYFVLSVIALCVAPYISVGVYYAIYPFALTYAVLYLAYVPSGVIRNFNNVEDYSYGIYLYAFPIQQMLVVILPGINIMQMIGASFILSVFCGALSWHFVEKRALAFKERAVSFLRSWVVAL